MSFNVLDRSENIFQTRFLEASAGTGKTFAIEHLYVRLLIEGMDPLTIPEILVVTFTKAATRELKLRIRSNIERALGDLEKRDTNLDYLKLILENTSKPAIFRLKNALAMIDEMQVYTIHAFCHKMLSEHAFEASESFQLFDPDTQDYKAILKNVVSDFFRTSLHPNKYGSSQLFSLLKKNHFDYNRLCTSVMHLIEKGCDIEEYCCFETLYKRFKEKLSLFAEVNTEKFIEDFKNLSASYNKLSSCAEKPVFLLANILKKKDLSFEEFDLLIKEECFLEKISEDNRKKRPKHVDWHYPGMFENIKEKIFPLLQEARDDSLLMLRIAKECQIRWERKKTYTLPDEFLKKMKSCIHDPEFTAKLRQRYQAAIIDEFQDTDATQWDIFKELFLSKTKAFYLVGDPKQSIYGFRNADVKTYLRAKEEIAKPHHASLNTNYRSDPALVEALNRLFTFKADWLKGLDIFPVLAGKKECEFNLKDDFGRVHFFIAEGESKGESWPTLNIEKDYFFPFITQEIQKLKGLGSLAVLVKDRYQAERIHAFFKKFNIQSVVKRAESLLDSPAYIALRDLFFAVKDPSHLSLVKRALAGPLFGWSAEDLLQKDMEEVRNHFYTWHHLLMKKGVGIMLADFFSKIPLESSWAPAFRQWVELLLVSAHHPYTFLEEVERTNVDEQEQYKVWQENEEGKVLIMTTHISKGLEFDFVFALGIASRHSQKDDFIKIDNKLIKRDDQTLASRLAEEDQNEEKLRQFYVALTRAKKRVYVALARDKKGSEGNSPCELFFQKWGSDLFEGLFILNRQCQLTYALVENAIALKKEEAILEKDSLEMPQGAILTKSCYLQSFSSLAEKRDIESVPLAENALPAGAETGHILHKIIERALGHEETCLSSIIQEEVISTPLESFESMIFEMISSLFQISFPLEVGKEIYLRDIPKKHLFQEMEFLYQSGQNWVKGFIDLAFIYEGKYYFVDWKSNLLADYSLETMEKAMQAHDYFLQASIYAKAMQKYFGEFSFECGGAFYVFLRGNAVYFIPPKELLC